MALRWPYLFYFISISWMQHNMIVSAAKDKALYCGACKAIVNEVEYLVSKVDPKKTIDVGTYRLDPSGKQKVSKVPYARSEIHVTEILEDVCSKMNGYAESKSDTGKRKYVRTSSRDGEAIELNNISMSGDISKKLKFACESIIEEHEDDFVALFAKSDKSIIAKVCSEIGEYCEETEDEEITKEEL